jgi:hypothetical protein
MEEVQALLFYGNRQQRQRVWLEALQVQPPTGSVQVSAVHSRHESNLTRGVAGRIDGVAASLERGYGRGQVFFLREQVIGVECREGEDADAGLCKWNRQRGEDANGGERNGPSHAQTSPALFALDAVWNDAFLTDDGEFV